MPNRKIVAKKRQKNELSDLDNSKQNKSTAAENFSEVLDFSEDETVTNRAKTGTNGSNSSSKKKRKYVSATVVAEQNEEQTDQGSLVLPGNTVSAQFFEDDEVVDMEVTAEDETQAFESEDDGEIIDRRETTNEDNEESENSESEELLHAKQSTSRRQSDESEVVFKNRKGKNNNNKRKSGDLLVDLNISDDEFDPAELKLM